MVDASPISRLKYKSDFEELQRAAFSIINEADPYRLSKKLHLKNWCRAFLALFIRENEDQNTFRRERLPFFLDVLLDQECWEETDTIHRVTLKRRVVAKKIVQSHSQSNIPNPLDFGELYRIACSCCLEDDVVILFERFKQNIGIKTDDSTEQNRLVVKELCKGRRSEPLTLYWSNLVGGFASEMQKEGKHLYEIGLELVYIPFVPYVEAVEYFWTKIRSLPVNELNEGQKYEIFIKTAVRSSANRMGELPEVFEYCIRQMTPNMYSDFLEKEYNEHHSFASLDVLKENLCFDLFQKLFRFLYPKYHVTDIAFYSTLQQLVMPEFSEYYVSEAVKLFMCMWMNEGCEKHRRYVLEQELRGDGNLLVCLITKNYMELVWAILDKENPNDMKNFMRTSKANYITSLLTQRRDQYLINKFLSYNYAIRQPESSTASLMDVDVTKASPTKKQRLE